MQKFDVQIALEGVKEARAMWAAAQTEFTAGVELIMARLLHEGAANYMSDAEIAKMVGMPRTRVRQMMKDIGLAPSEGKRVLSALASKALQENADLLRIEPHQMNLLSPLAYLPMGETLRRQLQDKTISQVTEEDAFPETEGWVETIQHDGGCERAHDKTWPNLICGCKRRAGA